jgi:hypothetical protein
MASDENCDRTSDPSSVWGEKLNIPVEVCFASRTPPEGWQFQPESVADFRFLANFSDAMMMGQDQARL